VLIESELLRLSVCDNGANQNNLHREELKMKLKEELFLVMDAICN
jgi:hypothetical protein